MLSMRSPCWSQTLAPSWFLVSESSSLLFRMYSFSSRNLQHNQKTPEDQCIHQMPDFYTVQHPTLQQIMKQGSPI